jgi:hypothetical protein
LNFSRFDIQDEFERSGNPLEPSFWEPKMPLEIIVGAVVGAAATSAVTSDKVRNSLRRGLVYSLAGVLVAYDKVSSLTTSAIQGARKAVADAQPAAAETAETNGAGHPTPPPHG